MKQGAFGMIIFMALAMLSCSSDNAPQPPFNETSGPISGTVNLFTNDGIPTQFNDMAISIVGTNFTATTDSEGDYNFPSVPFGDYTLVFEKENFGTFQKEVSHNKGFSQNGTQILTLSLGEISRTSVTETVEKIEDGNLLIRIVTVPTGNATKPVYVTIFFAPTVDVSNRTNQGVFGPLTFLSGNSGNIVTITGEQLSEMGFEIGDAVYFRVYGDSFHTNAYESDGNTIHPNVREPGSSIMSFVRQ